MLSLERWSVRDGLAAVSTLCWYPVGHLTGQLRHLSIMLSGPTSTTHSFRTNQPYTATERQCNALNASVIQLRI